MADIVYSMTGDASGLERAWQKANRLVSEHSKSLLNIGDSWKGATAESDKYAKMAERGMTQAFKAGQDALAKYKAELRQIVAEKEALARTPFPMSPADYKSRRLDARADYKRDSATIAADAAAHLKGADNARREAAALDTLNESRKRALRIVQDTEPALARMNRRLTEANALHKQGLMSAKEHADAVAKIKLDGTDTSGGALAGIGRMAAGFLTVGTAIRIARMEYDNLVARQVGALQQNINMALPAQQLYFNLGVDKLSGPEARSQLLRMAKETGVAPETIFGSASPALSGKGPLPAEAAMKSTRAVANFAPFGGAEAQGNLSFGVMGSLNQLGLDNAEQALGLLTAVGKSSAVTTDEALVTQVLPVLVGMVKTGASIKSAQAFLAAASQTRLDPRGRISGTGGVQLSEALEERYPEVKTFEERLAIVMGSMKEFYKMFGPAGGRYKALPRYNQATGKTSYSMMHFPQFSPDKKEAPLITEFMHPGNEDKPMRRAYKAALDEVPDDKKEFEKIYREKLRSQESDPSFAAARKSQQIKTESKLRRLADTESTNAGVFHDLREELNSAGLGILQSWHLNAEFWVRHKILRRKANDAAKESLEAMARGTDDPLDPGGKASEKAAVLRDSKKFFEESDESKIPWKNRRPKELEERDQKEDVDRRAAHREENDKFLEELRVAREKKRSDLAEKIKGMSRRQPATTPVDPMDEMRRAARDKFNSPETAAKLEAMEKSHESMRNNAQRRKDFPGEFITPEERAKSDAQAEAEIAARAAKFAEEESLGAKRGKTTFELQEENRRIADQKSELTGRQSQSEGRDGGEELRRSIEYLTKEMQENTRVLKERQGGNGTTTIINNSPDRVRADTQPSSGRNPSLTLSN